MNSLLAQLLLLTGIALAPLALGEAEENSKNTDVKAADVKTTETAPVAKPAKKVSSECLASEEIIQDIEAREQKINEREAQLVDREKEIEAQQKIVREELAKLEAVRAQIQGVNAQAMAEREEKVNKLIETFETMSPKAAAGVLGKVDDELAVTALSRLSTVKAGKILANLNPDKSSKLSELMAFGRAGKEKARGESAERAPANSDKR